MYDWVFNTPLFNFFRTNAPFTPTFFINLSLQHNWNDGDTDKKYLNIKNTWYLIETENFHYSNNNV